MGCDSGDSFPFDFEPNENPSGSKLKGKLSPRSYPIHLKGNRNIVFSVQQTTGAVVAVYNQNKRKQPIQN